MGGEVEINSSICISWRIIKNVNLGNRPSWESPLTSSMKFDEGKKLQKWLDVLIEVKKYIKFGSETTTFWLFLKCTFKNRGLSKLWTSKIRVFLSYNILGTFSIVKVWK